MTLRDDAGHLHRATAEGVLAPGEEVMLALDAFEPPPPAGFRPARIGVRAARRRRRSRRHALTAA